MSSKLHKFMINKALQKNHIMKKLITIFSLISLIVLSYAFNQQSTDKLNGAWRMEGDATRVAIIMDGYFVQSVYRENEPLFISTLGGTLDFNGSQLSGTLEFNSEEPGSVGEGFSLKAGLKNDKLTLVNANGEEEVWERIDKGQGDLAGVWRITGRKSDDGSMHEMKASPRKTLKVLSGTRFQWVAMNTETGEFFGTGGGTYTFKDNKYVETIGFFSRDNSKVGVSLPFEGEVKGDEWHHQGLSSKGDPIYEVWTKQ